MNPVIFDCDPKNVGKILKVKISDANQQTLFGKSVNDNSMRAA